jgi:hypothetical protein
MNPVTLPDGRVVDSSSEEWRAFCEANHVLNMPTKQARQAWLRGTRDHNGKLLTRGILQHRGEAATAKLEADVMRLWELRKPILPTS